MRTEEGSLLAQRFNWRSQHGRLLAPAWVVEEEAREPWTPLLEHAHELPGSQVGIAWLSDTNASPTLSIATRTHRRPQTLTARVSHVP